MVCTDYGCLHVGTGAKGCAVGALIGISNCRDTPCTAQLRRSTVNWLMARRSAVGAVPRNRRELNQSETGKGDAPRLIFTVNQITAKCEKGDPFWGLNPMVTVWSNHGGFEAISPVFGIESR